MNRRAESTDARLFTLLNSVSTAQSCSRRRHLEQGISPPVDNSQRIYILGSGWAARRATPGLPWPVCIVGKQFYDPYGEVAEYRQRSGPACSCCFALRTTWTPGDTGRWFERVTWWKYLVSSSLCTPFRLCSSLFLCCYNIIISHCGGY